MWLLTRNVYRKGSFQFTVVSVKDVPVGTVHGLQAHRDLEALSRIRSVVGICVSLQVVWQEGALHCVISIFDSVMEARKAWIRWFQNGCPGPCELFNLVDFRVSSKRLESHPFLIEICDWRDALALTAATSAECHQQDSRKNDESCGSHVDIE